MEPKETSGGPGEDDSWNKLEVQNLVTLSLESKPLVDQCSVVENVPNIGLFIPSWEVKFKRLVSWLVSLFSQCPRSFFPNSTSWNKRKHYNNYISWYTFLCVCTFSTANRSGKKLAERRSGWHQGKQIQAADYLIKACVWGPRHTRATAIGYTVQTAREKFRWRDQGKGRQLAMNWKKQLKNWTVVPPSPPPPTSCRE